jgi:uncharacterized iron-regulated membrane protein
MTLKKLAGKLHLWLGFGAGLVVLVSLLAAAVFVWEKELNEWYHHDKMFVKEVKATRLPFQTMLANARKVSYNNNITFVNIEKDPQKAFMFMNFKAAEKKGWTYVSGIEDYSKIYIDQYTGQVLGKIDMRHDWIFLTRMLHQCLLLNYDVGHYIVGYATLIIFIMVITGIVLWWPKNKAALKQRIWFRWKNATKWKRKNYDLHNIGGIYSLLFILIFALTGLAWTFDWWENAVYRMLGSHPDKVFSKAPEPTPAAVVAAGPYDSAFNDATKRVPNWRLLGFNIAATNAKKSAAINVFIRYSSGKSGWDESDNYSYHPQTGQLYHSITHRQKTAAAKWRNSNYAIHVGAIYGLPTKLLATFIALFCASLPVTGFYIWWGRRKKKKYAVLPGKASAEKRKVKRVPVLSNELS